MVFPALDKLGSFADDLSTAFLGLTHYPALRLFYSESTSSKDRLVPNTSPQPSPNP